MFVCFSIITIKLEFGKIYVFHLSFILQLCKRRIKTSQITDYIKCLIMIKHIFKGGRKMEMFGRKRKKKNGNGLMMSMVGIGIGAAAYSMMRNRNGNGMNMNNMMEPIKDMISQNRDQS